MLRALVLAAVLTPAAVSTDDEEQVQAVVLAEGDVLCIGYDRASETCLVKQTVSARQDKDITVLEEMILSDFGNDLRLTTLSKSTREGTRYCLIKDSMRATVVPEIHHAAPSLTAATIAGLNRYAQAEFCVEHRPCEGGHVAAAYAGDARFADEDTRYTLLKADDPRLHALDLRVMQISELDEVKGFAPVSCLPVQ